MDDSCVLVVDDDQLILELASSVFEAEGMEVHRASSGEEALRKLQDRKFVMMVTDLNMPGMNGLELAGKARQIVPDMLIFICSGDISPEIYGLAREAGIAKVFGKPFDFKEILAMIRRRT